MVYNATSNEVVGFFGSFIRIMRSLWDRIRLLMTYVLTPEESNYKQPDRQNNNIQYADNEIVKLRESFVISFGTFVVFCLVRRAYCVKCSSLFALRSL